MCLAPTVTPTEDEPAAGVLGATDPDGPGLSFGVLANGNRGTATVTNPATGAFTYTPDADANGSDTVTFRATDGTLQSNVAIVPVTIAAVNDAPVFRNGSTAAAKRSPVAGQLVATDVDGDALTFSLAQQATPGHGVGERQRQLLLCVRCSREPTDQFTFSVTDGRASAGVATVTVTILAGSGAPIAYDSTLSTSEDASVTGTLRARSPAPTCFGLDANGRVYSYSSNFLEIRLSAFGNGGSADFFHTATITAVEVLDANLNPLLGGGIASTQQYPTAPVPEPTSMLLLGSGVAAALASGARRHRR